MTSAPPADNSFKTINYCFNYNSCIDYFTENGAPRTIIIYIIVGASWVEIKQQVNFKIHCFIHNVILFPADHTEC